MTRRTAFLGVDTGSISTKGVVIDERGAILARSYPWAEGAPTDAARRVVDELAAQLDRGAYEVCAVGTTGSARRLVGAMLGAQVVKNEITAHAVGTTSLHPDVRTILEIGGQDFDMDVLVDADGHLMGAFGAALLAADVPASARRPFAWDVDDFEFLTREVVCGRCANHCEAVCVYRDDDLIDSWGNRCERGAVRPKLA